MMQPGNSGARLCGPTVFVGFHRGRVSDPPLRDGMLVTVGAGMTTDLLVGLFAVEDGAAEVADVVGEPVEIAEPGGVSQGIA